MENITESTLNQDQFLRFMHSLSAREAVILIKMFEELRHADAKYHDDKMSVEEIKASFNTLRCEVHELKREISRKKRKPSLLRKESIQVLAMGFKFNRDVAFSEEL